VLPDAQFGIATLNCLPTSTPKNSGDVTPMIGTAVPGPGTVCPTISARPPKRVCHSA
jgi:hypothetical protein